MALYVNWTSLTRNIGISPPLLTAVKYDMPWESVTEEIFKANRAVVQNVDENTGLMPFMIAAEGRHSILDSVYSLLIAYPNAINLGRKVIDE